MEPSKENKYATGYITGRPPHFETPEELHAKAIEYFETCVRDKEKVTITGLCLFLGFASRSSLDDYEKRNDGFSYIVKRCRLAVENSYEKGGQTIDIFALKNMGWKDKSEVDNNHAGTVQLIFEKAPKPDHNA